MFIFGKTNKALQEVFKSTSKFLYTFSPEETYKVTSKEALNLVKADYVSLYLKRDKKLERVYTTLPKYALTPLRKKGFTYKTFKEHKVFIRKRSAFINFHPQIESLGIKFIIFVPLSYLNKSVGVLTLDFSSDKKISSKDMEILKIFGSLANLAIRKTELYDEEQKAVKNRDLFISMAAHELKTPLTTINGYIDFLNLKTGKLDTAEGHWVKELKFEIERLTRLVKELLEIDQIKKDRLNIILREYPLVEVINKAINNFTFSYPERKLVFKGKTLDVSEMIVCDPDKLLEALGNILENAAKYSPSSSEIIIDIKFKKTQFVILIQDFGQGIPKQDLPKIFKDFYRGNTNFTDGMGLGLYLTKKIIQEHKGIITLTSKLNKGTKVKIKLPRYERILD